MTTISFKCPPLALKYMNRIMKERYLDRTSVIKLSLYLLCRYLRRPDIEHLNLFELVEQMETETSKEHISFRRFTSRHEENTAPSINSTQHKYKGTPHHYQSL